MSDAIADATPQRVRVVLAAGARPDGQIRPPALELTEQTRLGEALIRGLIRAQLSLALRLAGVVAIGLGSLPLLFAVAPAVARVRVFGVGLPWLLLSVGAYPFLYAVGATYSYLAARNEREFAELIDRREP